MTDSPYSSGLDPAAAGAPSAPPAPPVAPEAPASVPGTGTQLIAPVWHTIVLLIIILGNSYFASVRLAHNVQNRGRILLYLGTMVWQLLLFGLVWFGLRLKKTKLRDVIGGQWSKAEDFLLDGAIAAGFWIVSAAILVGLKFAFGLASLDAKRSADQVKQTIGAITPKTLTELAVFVLLALCAGFFEEIVFRGYLQKQIGAITRNAYLGLVIAAIIFGAGHGYQGTPQMVLIGLYGAMFGALALLRRSLRPGMMAHAWQDAFSGVAAYVLTKMGML
ncbi:MAG TPA: type II CAAX endopeptidase family protein [Candidatus Angelobacter sp.]|nr:type II CAAX endopeptidase family protein [Candidatus Angelobacter sp.]